MAGQLAPPSGFVPGTVAAIPIPAGTSDTVSGNNVNAVITLAAAGANISNVLAGLIWSYSAAPTGGRITVQDGSNTVLDLDITAAGPGALSWYPKKGSANSAMTITLYAGGSGVVGKLTLGGAWTAPT